MDDYQAVTFRISREVYENLRTEAFATRRPMNEIVNESLAVRYAGKGKVIHHKDGDPRNMDPDNLELRKKPS